MSYTDVETVKKCGICR